MAEKKYPSETQDRFIVRFPDDAMRARIAAEAEKNGRSMNSEIISRLQDSFSSTGDLAERVQWVNDGLNDRMADLKAELDRAVALVESYKRIEAISSGTTAALAQYVITLHERLSPKIRRELNTAIAYRLALALLNKDGAGLASVFGDLFADDLEVVREMHRLRLDFSQREVAVTVRGQPKTISLPIVDTSGLKLSDGPLRKPQSAAKAPKVVLVGNIGREPATRHAAPKAPANKGPAKRTRGKPPK